MVTGRKNTRLPEYDYSTPGTYLVTVCVQHKRAVFGSVIDGALELNAAGRMVGAWWDKLPSKFDNINPDVHITMPDHFHGLVLIVGADPCVRPGAHAGAPLHQIMRWFKTMTTNSYIRGVKDLGWTPFEKQLWQRGYHEHVVRKIEDLNAVREYILNNPLRWDKKT